MTTFFNCVRFCTKRFNSSSTLSVPVLEALSHRTLIRVSGSEVSPFLQGLITNDIEHLHSGHPSMFTIFLNSAGRILYDTLIYKTSEKNTFLIECDKEASPVLQKHLKLYRVRRKIDIVDVGDELQIYVLFNPDSSSDLHLSESLEGKLQAFRDPRIVDLGVRILVKCGEKINIESRSGKSYKWLRYSLGVGEGVCDHPPGDSFPLECNGDYLHGVSFQKGCYIGQELTARVHHTGFVRKRLMPLVFTKIPKNPNKKIVQDSVNLGKLRGIEEDLGLASLRFEKALSFKELKVGDGVAITSKPKWWPSEASKDKLNI